MGKQRAQARKLLVLFEPTIRRPTALTPGDVNAEPRQIAASGGGNGPVYRTAVRLASQRVNAYGADLGTAAGPQLEAEIALEMRRLYEWLLDPLYAFTGGRLQ